MASWSRAKNISGSSLYHTPTTSHSALPVAYDWGLQNINPPTASTQLTQGSVTMGRKSWFAEPKCLAKLE